MNELDFVNSPVDKSEKFSQDDWTCGEILPLGQEERNLVIPILKKYTDVLAVYRSTLSNHIRQKNSIESEIDLDHNDAVFKLNKDSLYVSHILEDLISDVETNGRYDVLVHEIENNRLKIKDETAIRRNYEKTAEELDQLEKRFQVTTEANSQERERLEANLMILKTESKRWQQKANVEMDYVIAREEARREASSLQCDAQLEDLKQQLIILAMEEKNEHRAATDIIKFLKLNISENERATSEWEDRYEREMLSYTNTIEHLNKEIEIKRKTLEKFQLQYRERQEFIETYLAEKEAAAELRKREEHRRDCAIKIQSWWRGVMVRRKLGPYRPDEKKKKRAAKTKK